MPCRTSNSGKAIRLLSIAASAAIGTLAVSSADAAIISIVSGNPATYGRIKVGSTPSRVVNLNKSPTGVTSWTATTNNNGISVTPASGTTSNGNNQAINLTVAVVNNANGSGTVGVKSTYTVTVDNTTDPADPNDIITTSMTVVADRDLSQQGGAINLGNVFVNTNTTSSSATITGGSASDNEATRVTLGTGNVTQNGVTVGGGSSFLFDAANETTTRTVFGNFSTSGAKSGNVNIASQLTNSDSISSGGGSVVLDSTVNVAFTATAWDPASLTANTGTTLNNGSNVSIVNAAGAFRSAGFVDSTSISTGWTLNNLSAGNSVTTSGTPTANVSFNSQAGLLNGYVATGTLTIEMENNQTITGAANQDGPTLNWNLAHTVSGNVGDGSAPVAAAGAYDNLSGTSDEELGSVATILDGANTNGGQTTVAMSWRARNANEKYPTGTTPPLPPSVFGLVSDVVDLSGTAGDVFVLQLGYDETELHPWLTEAQAAAQGWIYLAWLDSGQWELATDNNTGVNTTNPLLLNYQGSWASSGAGLTLGAYGVDTSNNVVWAVLDHNSEFAAVPEPSLVGLPALVALLSRRRRN